MGGDGMVLVTGANGFVGSHLTEHLLASGDRVRALVRRTGDLRFLPAAAEVAYGDVTRPASLPPALRGVRRVYHVAGVVAARRARTFFEVNEAGTRSLIRACVKAAPDLERFLLVSSLAAAGPAREGRPRRESEVPRPVSEYGRSKLGGELAALAHAGEIPVTVVRPPVVYGPRDRDLLTFFEVVGRGWRPVFPREKFYSIVHARDLARGIRLAAETEAARGRTYNLAESRAWSLGHLLELIAGALGVSPRRLPVPEALLRLAGGPADALADGLGLPLRPFGDKVREMLPDFWIADTGAARRDLGFRTEIPLPEGLREVAAFYLDAGWLEAPGK